MVKATNDYKGELIKEYRLKKSLPQNEFSKQLGIQPQFLCRLEKSWSPTPDHIFIECIRLLEIPESVIKREESKRVNEYLKVLFNTKKSAA